MEGCPTIFAFNLLGKVAQNFDYKRLIRSSCLQRLVESGRLHFLPVINYAPSSIDERAEQLTWGIDHLLTKLGAAQFNMVAYSLTGVDARHALKASTTLSSKLRRLLTTASPHNGSEFFIALQDGNIPGDAVQNLMNLMGLFPSDLHEFSPAEMKRFNEKTADEEDSRLFSVNGNTGFGRSTAMLQEVNEILLRRAHPHIFNDGIFFTHETKLGSRHIAEFSSDHIALGPFSPTSNDNAFNFYADFSTVGAETSCQ